MLDQAKKNPDKRIPNCRTLIEVIQGKVEWTVPAKSVGPTLDRLSALVDSWEAQQRIAKRAGADGNYQSYVDHQEDAEAELQKEYDRLEDLSANEEQQMMVELESEYASGLNDIGLKTRDDIRKVYNETMVKIVKKSENSMGDLKDRLLQQAAQRNEVMDDSRAKRLQAIKDLQNGYRNMRYAEISKAGLVKDVI